jgi:ribose transport system substrate-binding protein
MRVTINHSGRWLLAGVCAVACAAITACGSSGSSSNGGTTSSGSAQGQSAKSVTLDGIKIPVDGPLKLAVFLPGTNNADLQSRVKELHRRIDAIPGASLTIFDAKFDVTIQLNQIQNAIQSGKYNAAIAAPLDGQLLCSALSQQAPKAGMLVAVPNLALCGRYGREGDAQRAPGTLTFVGGTQTVSYWHDYLTWIAKQNPGPQKVIVLTDPEGFPLTLNFDKALPEVQKANPNLEVVGKAATDLTVPGSNQKMTALIQAHPDATILVTMFSTETQGAVEALRAAGKLGKLKIYDKGATKWAVAQLKQGVIAATSPERAVTSTTTMVDAILAARDGKPFKAFYNNDGGPTPADAPPSGFTVYTKQTIGDFQGEN